MYIFVRFQIGRVSRSQSPDHTQRPGCAREFPYYTRSRRFQSREFLGWRQKFRFSPFTVICSILAFSFQTTTHAPCPKKTLCRLHAPAAPRKPAESDQCRPCFLPALLLLLSSLPAPLPLPAVQANMQPADRCNIASSLSVICSFSKTPSWIVAVPTTAAVLSQSI